MAMFKRTNDFVLGERLKISQDLHRGLLNGRDVVLAKVVPADVDCEEEIKLIRKFQQNANVADLRALWELDDGRKALIFDKFDVSLSDCCWKLVRNVKMDRLELCRQMMEIYIFFHENGYVIRSANIASFNLVWINKKLRKALIKIYGLGCVKKGLRSATISKEKCKLPVQMFGLPAPLRVFRRNADPTTYSFRDDLDVLGDFIFRIFNRRNSAPTPLSRPRTYAWLPRRYEAYKFVELLKGRGDRVESTADLRFHPIWWSECQSNEFIKAVAAVIDQQESAVIRRERIPTGEDVKIVLGSQENLKIALEQQHTGKDVNWLLALEERERAEVCTHNKSGKWLTHNGYSLVDMIKVMRHSTAHMKENSLFAYAGPYNFSTAMERKYERLIWTVWDLMKEFAADHTSLSMFYPPPPPLSLGDANSSCHNIL